VFSHSRIFSTWLITSTSVVMNHRSLEEMSDDNVDRDGFGSAVPLASVT
jgi:hypothetical protein